MGGAKQGELLEYNRCQEAVRKLDEYLSHELGPDEETELQRHLSQCKGCFSRFHFEETLLRTIRARVEQIRAPLSLQEKILDLLAAQDSPAGYPQAIGNGAEGPV